MKVRRVVTGHDENGKAVVVSDEELTSTSPDNGEKWSVWAADTPITFPDDGRKPPFRGPLLPKPGGFHVVVFTLPAKFDPDAGFPDKDPARMAAIVRSHMAAMRDTHPIVQDPNPPGSYGTTRGASAMHATASIDCLMQISGETVLVLENAEVKLCAGDWLIVNGVMHSFRNDLDQEAVMIGVVYGVNHKGAPLREQG